MRIIRFCNAGTTASPTSTARSPRATIMASDASRISSWRESTYGTLDFRNDGDCGRPLRLSIDPRARGCLRRPQANAPPRIVSLELRAVVLACRACPRFADQRRSGSPRLCGCCTCCC
jgi:hypothetical protein